MSSSIDPQLQTMIDNMPEKTGRALDEWFQAISAAGAEAHGDIMKLLKGGHSVSHGYANTISILYRQKTDGGAPSGGDLIDAQFAGAKSGLRPLYDALIAEVRKFGSDVEIEPKKTYVSLRRSKQFAIVQPATKDRIDLGLNLKGVDATERLEGGTVFSGMCTHRVRITAKKDIDAQLRSWLKQAYEQA
ncbi:MAG: DUF4287 domain-containing protein [Bacteroidetes bacterium]|nr:DUF4287 domain-containing protein [Bacteroidota bacterium]